MLAQWKGLGKICFSQLFSRIKDNRSIKILNNILDETLTNWKNNRYAVEKKIVLDKLYTYMYVWSETVIMLGARFQNYDKYSKRRGLVKIYFSQFFP